MRSAKNADRDLARQLDVVRAIARAVDGDACRKKPNEALDLIDRVSGVEHFEDDAGPLGATLNDHGGIRRDFYAIADMDARLLWALGLKDDSGKTVQAALKRACQLGAARRVATPPSVDGLGVIARDFPHCVDVIEFVRRRTILASVAPETPMHLPPILLSGPAGTGKTALSQRLADWLSVPLVNVDMSTVDASFKLTGLDAGYSSGKPGMVWDALNHECMAPVIVLDELDKQSKDTRHSGLGYLLGLLEPSTACRYQDACLGLPVDASHVTWIATCNDLDALDAPLRSRFRVFDIGPPSREQMRAVARSVYRQMQMREPWASAFEKALSDAVLMKLAERTPRELLQALEDACANAAVNGRRHLLPQDLPIQAVSERRQPMGFLG